MANNPYVNKVQFGNTTVMDISDSDVTESDVVSGKTFYKASGAKSTGSAVIPDISNCYQTTDPDQSVLADDDKFPFYDTSDSAKSSSTWSNIKSKLKGYFDTIYAAFSAFESELKDTVGWVSKNVVPLTLDSIKALNTSGSWSSNAYTLNSVVFTVNTNSDGYVTSIATSGTASASTTLTLLDGTISSLSSILPSGQYIMNGCPNGGGTLSGHRMKFMVGTSSFVETDTSDMAFTISGSSSTALTWSISCSNGTSMASKTFYPMIRKKSVADATFEPYHGTVATALSGKADTSSLKDLAYINKDGVSSTKVLQGDGTWVTLPTVNDATLTIQQNGTTKGTFTANASTNATANIVTDEWTTAQSLASGDTSKTFTGLSSSYAYKPFIQVADGETAPTGTMVFSGTSATVTFSSAITAAQAAGGVASIKLRIIK